LTIFDDFFGVFALSGSSDRDFLNIFTGCRQAQFLQKSSKYGRF